MAVTRTEVTLTLDQDLLETVERLAEEEGVTVSRWVETALQRRLGTAGQPTFSARWKGRFRLRDQDDCRFRHLAAKYA